MTEKHAIIIGVADLLDRPAWPGAALEPLALMERACKMAAADAGLPGLGDVARLEVINLVSWPYAAPAEQLAARLGLAGASSHYGPAGGEQPTAALARAADAVTQGDAELAVVTGAEAQHAVAAATRAGLSLEWTPPSKNVPHPINPAEIVGAAAMKAGLVLPVHIYPLYDSAVTKAWGEAPGEARERAAQLYEIFAQQAATIPSAWRRDAPSAVDIAEASAANRMICWPYTKSVVANPSVNQGAAILIASKAYADKMGIAAEKRIYLSGAAKAAERRNFLHRARLDRSPAMQTVLAGAARTAGPFGLTELYSCFPIIPRMAQRILLTAGAVSEGTPLTVTGGLSFFGAPLNTYMTHATVHMTQRLRAANCGRPALLYGQGEFVTKHHALWLQAEPTAWQGEQNLQADMAAEPAPPPLVREGSHTAQIEAFTVLFDRAGRPERGAVIAQTDQAERAACVLPVTDQDGIATLLNDRVSPVGARGLVDANQEGPPVWRFAP